MKEEIQVGPVSFFWLTFLVNAFDQVGNKDLLNVVMLCFSVARKARSRDVATSDFELCTKQTSLSLGVN